MIPLSTEPLKVYFEITRAGEGNRQWIWRIRSHGNNEVLASSELLNTRAAAENAMRTVRQDASFTTHVWDQTVSGGAAWVGL